MLKTFTAALLVFLAPATLAAQQTSSQTSVIIPKTPAGNALRAWLTAFDSGDRETYRAFMQTWEPSRLPHIDDVMQFRTLSGGFELRAIESSTPSKIVAIFEDRNNQQFARGELSVTSASPYQIASFPITAIGAPPQFAPAHLDPNGLVAAAKARAAEGAASGRFSGAVLVARNGQTLFSAAYGMADRANKVPNTVDTRFRIGSMNKMFTAVAIMQLVQAGKVRLDAPFGTYVTDYPNKDVASQVTIAQLLTHSGGTGDIFGPEFDKHRLDLRSLSDYEKIYGARGLAFTPGSKTEYSNYGYILLGLVVERASGQSYYDYVAQHVFAPAGMTSTGSEPEDQSVAGRSLGYTLDDKGQWTSNADTLPYRGSPAGGGYSTVGDLLRFANALLTYKLLDETHTHTLSQPRVELPGGIKYGYGFGTETINGNRCFGHNGGAPGQNGDLEICPESGYVVTALANVDPPAASSITDFIVSRLPLADH